MLVTARNAPVWLACLLTALPVWAAPSGIVLSGVFGDKAVVTFPDGTVRTLKKNAPAIDSVRLLSTDAGGSALVDIDGRQMTLTLGAEPVRLAPSAASASGGAERLVVRPDSRGHLFADGAINGTKMRFMVDTGATLVAISAADAQRAGIDYRKGQRGISHTANGPVATWTVMFATVRVGDMVLHNVEGAVLENGLTTPLLGMSALKRIEMRPESGYFVLRKRY